jgi:excisionase family DNA binding protein
VQSEITSREQIDMGAQTLTPTLLSADEVAQLTGLSIDTLAQWRSQRRGIPYLKIGRAIRYDLTDVQNYLRGCRVSVSDSKERRWNERF